MLAFNWKIGLIYIGAYVAKLLQEILIEIELLQRKHFWKKVSYLNKRSKEIQKENLKILYENLRFY